MDRYLYKAKKIKDRQWIEGYLIYSFTGAPFIVTEYDHILALVARDEVDPETICQCTGLKDKNGELIWENDIAWDSDERAFYEIVWNQEDMCWNVEDADGHKSEFEECYVSTLEVNGNRFDNPELLESEE